MKKINYSRLSFEEREEISRGLAAHQSLRIIAVHLGRSASTISREVHLVTPDKEYRAFRAHRQARVRVASRRLNKRKLILNPSLRHFVTTHLKRYWSPDQIAKLLVMRYPENMTMRISPEAIYQYIYVLPRGTLRRVLVAGLRQERKFRRPQGAKTTETRGKLADMLSIEERPSEVADRSVPGHWEGDVLLGQYRKSAVGTLVERTTRFTLLVPLRSKDAVAVRKAYARAIRKLPRHLAKSLTYDQGKEMSQHRQFTVATGIQVYFAHPGSPWERGTNENTNGLIRQFFPKTTDFTHVSTSRIKRVQDLLNERPRKTLDYRTPKEIFNQLVALKSRD